MAKRASLSQHRPCQPCWMPLGHCRWCWWRQRRPWQGRTLHVFLVQSHNKQSAPRHNSPGSAPKKRSLKYGVAWQCLPSPCTFEIGNICPFGNFDSCKAPCAKFKSIPLHQWAAAPPSLLWQNQDSKMAYLFFVPLSRAGERSVGFTAADGTQAKYLSHQWELLLNAT